jgi:hypothetical protein
VTRRSITAGTAFAVVLGMLPASLTAPAILASGTLVDHWTFDEPQGPIVHDTLGGLDGSLEGGVTRIAGGFASRALRFDGDGDRVVVADHPRLRAQVMSLSLWVRATSPGQNAVLVEGGDADCAGGAYGILVDGDAVKLRARTAWDGGYHEATIAQEILDTLDPLWDGAWHHIGIGLFGAEWGSHTLYVDGREVAGLGGYTGVMPATLDHAAMDTTTFSIGGPAGACDRPGFAGDIDDVRVFEGFLLREEFGALEPAVPTSFVFGAMPDFKVDEAGLFSMAVTPPPYAGAIELIYVDEFGVEHSNGRGEVERWNWKPTLPMSYKPRLGGNGTLVFRYHGSPPWEPFEVSTPISIERAWTQTVVQFQTLPQADQPLYVGVTVGGIAYLDVEGTVTLFERVDGELIELGSAELEEMSSFAGGYQFELPARAAGTYEFEARYSGNRSFLPSQGSGIVEVKPALVVGEVVIDDGAQYTNSPIVKVSAAAEGAVAMIVTPHPDIWQPSEPYAPVKPQQWMAAPWWGNDVDGVHEIYVKWADSQSTWSDWRSDSIILDRSVPAVGVPTASLTTGASVASGAPVRLAWTASDATSGIARYDVQLQTDGRTWAALPSPGTAKSLARTLAPGHAYRFRVRATDMAGNMSAWVYGPTFPVRAYAESSGAVRYRGTWATSSSTSFWGGHAKPASVAGSTASLTFTGRSIAWVSYAGSTRGMATVWVDGTKMATIDLAKLTAGGKRIAWQRTWASSATRTVTIRVTGTSGRPRVDVDGFLTL